MNIGGFRLAWLKRRWWVIVACGVAVTLVALIFARPEPTSYTATAVLLVRSGATENTPGNANEANRLAVTYSQLIPQDLAVLDAVSAALGVDRAEVSDSITATNESNTSILNVQYTADTSATAVSGARAVADALVGTSAAASNFRGLGLSRLPDTALRNVSSGTAIPVGLLLGLLLGAVIAVALERSRGRIDQISDVESELNCPVTALQGLSTGSIIALLQRWNDMATAKPASVAIVTAAQGQRALSQEVSIVFATTANVAGESADTMVQVFGLEDLSLRGDGAPGTWEVGEQIIQRSDLTVLVVGEGSSIAELRGAVEAMADFGAKPTWALFASDAVVRRSRRHHGLGEPTTTIVAAPTASAEQLS